MQLDRLLQSQGFGSRKECRALIREGGLKIAGAVHKDPFTEVEPQGFSFEIDEWEWEYQTQVYVALHKPAGYECSHKPKHNESVYHLLPDPLIARGIQSVGRLDVDTTGLLLFSDDGHFIHAISSAKRQVTKTYDITTAETITDAQIAQLIAGVDLIDEREPVTALSAQRTGEQQLQLVVDQGKYHLVKRMIAAAGNHVAQLHRSAVGPLALNTDKLPELEPSDWCYLRPHHLALFGYPPAKT